MKAYFCLAIGALWIIVAAFFSFGRFSFGIRWTKGIINPAVMINDFPLNSLRNCFRLDRPDCDRALVAVGKEIKQSFKSPLP
jgi:hypothetical protein